MQEAVFADSAPDGQAIGRAASQQLCGLPLAQLPDCGGWEATIATVAPVFCRFCFIPLQFI